MTEGRAQSLPPIPVANLLRIAFYAGDLLDEFDDCEAAHEDGARFDDVLQAMLARAADRIRLRGFERGYSQDEELTTRPRGRMLVAESIASCAIPTRRLACRFDEFGADTPHNRVLKAAARQLAGTSDESPAKDGLRALVREMREVDDVRLSRRLLSALPRSIATRRYRVVRFIARLIGGVQHHFSIRAKPGSLLLPCIKILSGGDFHDFCGAIGLTDKDFIQGGVVANLLSSDHQLKGSGSGLTQRTGIISREQSGLQPALILEDFFQRIATLWSL